MGNNIWVNESLEHYGFNNQKSQFNKQNLDCINKNVDVNQTNWDLSNKDHDSTGWHLGLYNT